MPIHAARLALTRSVTQKAVAPSMGPALRVRALRHARRPRALTRGRPAVPRQPGTGRSRRTARREALSPAALRRAGRAACAARRRLAARLISPQRSFASKHGFAASRAARPLGSRGARGSECSCPRGGRGRQLLARSMWTSWSRPKRRGRCTRGGARAAHPHNPPPTQPSSHNGLRAAPRAL